jgi:hypothetical protein
LVGGIKKELKLCSSLAGMRDLSGCWRSSQQVKNFRLDSDFGERRAMLAILNAGVDLTKAAALYLPEGTVNRTEESD